MLTSMEWFIIDVKKVSNSWQKCKESYENDDTSWFHFSFFFSDILQLTDGKFRKSVSFIWEK